MMRRNPELAHFENAWGIVMPLAMDKMPKGILRSRWDLAMDAQPVLVTQPNSGVPAYLTMYYDPEVIRILQAECEGAAILGEKKLGDWTTRTTTVSVVENTGEVSMYGDYNNNGISGVNVNFVQRQSVLFQTTTEYGDYEEAEAGLAKLNWVSENQTAAALTLSKFSDYTYHFGVAGLQNYGLLNDPSLSAALTPSTKAAGGIKWVNNGTINATANEVTADVQGLYAQLVAQTLGRVKRTDGLTLAMAPQSEVGLSAVNSFGISAADLLAKTYPGLKVKVSARYATAGGNVIQLYADKFDGKDVGYCGFNEKLRDHTPVRQLSSWQQKKTAGSFGAIIRYPVAVSQGIGY